jgi:hypothetical protein
MVWRVLWGVKLKQYDLRPDLGTLETHSNEKSESTVKRWVAQECSRSISINEPLLRTKAQEIDQAVMGLAPGSPYVSRSPRSRNWSRSDPVMSR